MAKNGKAKPRKVLVGAKVEKRLRDSIDKLASGVPPRGVTRSAYVETVLEDHVEQKRSAAR